MPPENHTVVVRQGGVEFAYGFSQDGGMSTNAQRFGEIVRHRREVELDLTQLEVSAAGGPSNTTQTKIENGLLDELTRSTARKLDAGLLWEPGSAREVWEGGEPVSAGGERRAPARGYDWLRARVDEALGVPVSVRAQVRHLLDDQEGRRAG